VPCSHWATDLQLSQKRGGAYHGTVVYFVIFRCCFFPWYKGSLRDNSFNHNFLYMRLSWKATATIAGSPVGIPAIFQSYSGWEKFVSKKSERGDSGMGQHGQRFNTGTCFSVSSDDKLVLFLFPGIPTGDPAIVAVAFHDKRIYKKLWLKELSLSDPLYHGKKQHRNRCPCWPIPESPLSDFLLTNFSHPEYDWNIACWTISNQSINQFAHTIVSSYIDVSTLLFNMINIPW
jgi:hypothetical protein